MKRPSLETIYMGLAHMMAQRSTCSRLRVGAVVASPDLREVYAVAYNGGAMGQGNECESTEPGACGHVHAEANALSFAPARVPKIMFVTHSPCAVCAKLMVNKLGFERVHYVYEYRDNAGLVILGNAGIACQSWGFKKTEGAADLAAQVLNDVVGEAVMSRSKHYRWEDYMPLWRPEGG